MKKRIISAVLCFAAVFLCGKLAAQTQAELHEQVKDLAEIKEYVRSASFEDATPWKVETPNWENTGFQGQDNTAFPEMTGSRYCEKWVPDGQNIADSHIYQTCNLPNGQYVLSVDAKATQRDQGGIEGFYFVARDGDWDVSNLLRESITGPLNFTVEEEGTPKNIITYYLPITITTGKLTLGILAEGATANYVRFDNFRLFTPDAIPVLKNEILNRLDQILSFIGAGNLPSGYNTLLNEGDNPLYNSAIEISENSTDETELTLISDSLGNVLARAEAGAKLFETLYKGIDLAELLANTTDYSGKIQLNEAYDAAIELVSDPNAFNPEFEKEIEDLKIAIKAYKTTQSDNASPENPVDLTFLIDTPNFSQIPDFGEDDITDNSTASKGAWVTHNVYSPAFGDHDSRLNYCSSKNCWNNWSRSFYSLDLHQTLRNLPEGVYSVELLTCSDALGNARGYAQSKGGIVYSPIHTQPSIETPFAQMAVWEKLTTDKIYVAENDTLCIGISSSNSDGNNTNGWFCATEFKLLYYGKSDNANKLILEMKLGEIEILDVEGSITDKALTDLRAVIAKAQDLYSREIFSGEEYENVLAEIDSIIPLTKERASVYAQFRKKDTEISDFVNRGESEICDLIAAVQEEYAAKIQANADIDIAEFEEYTQELDQYLAFANTFMTYEAYTARDDFDATSLVQYATELYAVMEFVDQNGITSLPEAEKQLQKALDTLIYHVASEGDVTFLVANPSFEENTGTSPIGWTNRGFNVANNGNFRLNGNPAYTGANFCEQWVSAGSHGHLGDIQIYQTAQLPNGEYTLAVDGMCFQQDDLVAIEGFYFVAKNGNWESSNELVKEPILYPYKEITAEGDTVITYSINVMVTTGKLTFGVITENTNANWIMCDNFRITLNKKYAVGVENIYDANSEEVLVYTDGRRIIAPEHATIYTLNGLSVRNSGEMQPGVYLVRVGEKTQKILIK